MSGVVGADGDTVNPWLLGPGKRTIDAVVSIVVLLVLSPVIASVAMIVRVSLGRGVIFRQERAGVRGASFDVLKFRTMVASFSEDWDPARDEERITRVGRLLRSTSLDELPQLWNVVRGDMSLVGPRPLPMRYVDRYSPEQRERLRARPGITGLAVVKGRNALSWEDKFRWDVEYVRTASLRRDLRILVMTLAALVKVRTTRAEGHATMPEFMGSMGS